MVREKVGGALRRGPFPCLLAVFRATLEQAKHWWEQPVGYSPQYKIETQLTAFG